MDRLRIAIISRWNATCGESVHAELIGRKLVELGYRVRVYAPTIASASRDWHHRVVGSDEDYVERVYDEGEDPSKGVFRGESLLEYDPDIIIVEAYYRLPMNSLRSVLVKAKSKGSRIVLVLHEGVAERAWRLLLAPFDKLVVFDHRWIREVLYPVRDLVCGKVEVIPYPCAEPPPGVRVYRPEWARGKILLVSFGRQPFEEYVDYVRALKLLSRRYSLVYYIVRSDCRRPPFSYPWVRFECRRLSLREVFSLLEASDIHLLPKGWTSKVVVSSTVYQTLSSLTPIVAPDTRYFETIRTDERGLGAIVKYFCVEDLRDKIAMLIDDESVRELVRSEAKRLLEECSTSIVSKRIVEAALGS